MLFQNIEIGGFQLKAADVPLTKKNLQISPCQIQQPRSADKFMKLKIGGFQLKTADLNMLKHKHHI